MKSLTFRQARAEDLPHLVVLLEKLFTIEEDFHSCRELQQQGLSLLLDTESCTIFVCIQDENIVAMVTGQITISTAEGGPSLLVEDLYVERKVRGRGIGRTLLEKIGTWGATQGADRMQLLADCNNHDALGFYASTHWRKTQLIVLRKYYSRNKS